MQEVRTKIENYLKEYNKAKGYSFIISYEPGLVYYKDSIYNITGDVVKGLNEMYKKKKDWFNKLIYFPALPGFFLPLR